MSAPAWHGYGERLPLRDIIRDHCLRGDEGLAVEDLDLVLRRFTPDDKVGRFRLVEHKYGSTALGDSKRMTFGLMDALLRVADPDLTIYDGWYVLRTPIPETALDPLEDPATIFQVNTAKLTRSEFFTWADFGDVVVEPRPPAPTFAGLIAGMAPAWRIR